VVRASSRATVAVHEAGAGVGRGQRHGTTVEATNGVSLVVERPTYFRYASAIDGGGHNVMGARAEGDLVVRRGLHRDRLRRIPGRAQPERDPGGRHDHLLPERG
jgi:hypothetical protein